MDYSKLFLLKDVEHKRFLDLFRACIQILSRFEDIRNNVKALATQFEHAEFYVEKPLAEAIPKYIYIKVDKTSPEVVPCKIEKKGNRPQFTVSIPATEKYPYVDDVTGELRPVGSSVGGGINFWFDKEDDYKWVDVADLLNYGVEDLDWPEPEQILYWSNQR